jgi:hypothetical protein
VGALPGETAGHEGCRALLEGRIRAFGVPEFAQRHGATGTVMVGEDEPRLAYAKTSVCCPHGTTYWVWLL